MRVMIVGAMSGQLAVASKIAMDRGAKVTQVDTILQATAALRAGRGADLLMVDVAHDIAALIAANEAERIMVPVVACGVSTDPRTAASAIRAGAREFVPLPPDPELIAAVLAAVCDDERPMIAKDPAMQSVVALAEQIAPSDASVLITGESGVGKEVMARHLHQRSRRADKPFISVNCAAIPDNLLESELFGHEKGAFTGAIARRIGKFEEADGGTLLLDEISEMDLRLQAKLLRAIQERVIDRVGGSKPVPVNIRILATSNRDLQEEVGAGRFREDLYYRLNVVNLRLPPLRDRPADLVALTDFFVKKYAAANAVAAKPLSPAAREAIAANHWRGNVRELENAMHRAVLLATGPQIDAGDIRGPDGSPAVGGFAAPSFAPAFAPAHALASAASGPAAHAAIAAESVTRSLVGRTIEAVEQDMILDTLRHCHGNRTHAAQILGISIRTLRNKLKLYLDAGVAVPQPGAGDMRHAFG
jgi:DNA-binding NtrC family response regulator